MSNALQGAPPRRAKHASMADHSQHQDHLNPWLLAGLGGVGAIVAAPYILPMLGIGSASTATSIGHYIGGHGSENFGAGLAGGVQGMIAGIPGIGEALTSSALVTLPGLGIGIASGALMTVAATAVIGIGGVLFANWLEKHEDPNAAIQWSKIIRTAALVTSGLIALPGLLSGLSIGITFLTGVVASAVPALATLPSETVTVMKDTLGATSMEMGGLSGLGALLPHLFTCGLAALPVVGALFLPRDKPENSVTSPQRIDRLHAPQPALAHQH